MNDLNQRQLSIIEIVKSLGKASFSVIFETLLSEASERSVKRDLSGLVEGNFLQVSGGGRATTYTITESSRIFLPIDVDIYNAVDIDSRVGVCERYVISVWEQWPGTLFTESEIISLEKDTNQYRLRSQNQTPDMHKRELERFVIEMSWKSSQIEGNTYTLLDTELLLKDGIASSSNTKEETQMILNHKEAFQFVIEHVDAFVEGLTFALLEQVHTILMKDLIEEKGIRASVVGITGSRYQPLDNQFQLREALEKLIETVNESQDVWTQALTALIGMSYVQPFVDGNKRTARLIANGLLLSKNCSPLSYRDVNERTYRSSLLVFYEQLSVVPMKQLFIDQYNFSAEHYTSLK
ncbi:MAG: fido (protein-threonine AMPylation protein) [Acidimicrobiales bacterium]|jgi:fido (protein-threonine AMPylation protein)